MGGGWLVGGPWVRGKVGGAGRVGELGWEYVQVLALFRPVFCVSAVLRSILAGEGDAKTPMIVLGVSTVANIGRDAAEDQIPASIVIQVRSSDCCGIANR